MTINERRRAKEFGYKYVALYRIKRNGVRFEKYFITPGQMEEFNLQVKLAGAVDFIESKEI